MVCQNAKDKYIGIIIHHTNQSEKKDFHNAKRAIFYHIYIK